MCAGLGWWSLTVEIRFFQRHTVLLSLFLCGGSQWEQRYTPEITPRWGFLGHVPGEYILRRPRYLWTEPAFGWCGTSLEGRSPHQLVELAAGWGYTRAGHGHGSVTNGPEHDGKDVYHPVGIAGAIYMYIYIYFLFIYTYIYIHQFNNYDTIIYTLHTPCWGFTSYHLLQEAENSMEIASLLWKTTLHPTEALKYYCKFIRARKVVMWQVQRFCLCSSPKT